MRDNDKKGLDQYIAENIDQAIENGWIQVYYQPVVRALTGKLSSVEALTRWIEPVRGVISPGVFIPVLEKTRQIQKLDLFVIDQVARMIRDRSDKGESIVPVSFNLSRVDFAESDPYQVTENCVKKYGINRRLLKVEITESTLISDPDKLHSMFGLFHDQGYDIWMDDFGSGYSTLNVLKDYSFDEIKIDMAFLRGFNERGRNIVASIVRMAKSLQIHTLTEGAETREQVDFLKKIGCEKIQGYFYGAPMPYDVLLQHCADFGLEAETADEAYLYDVAGSVDFLSEEPVILLEEKKGNLSIAYFNDRSRQPIAEIARSMGLPEDSRDVFSFDKRLSDRMAALLDTAKRSEKDEVFNLVYSGQYYRLHIRTLAGVNDHYMHLLSMYNITYDITQKEKRHFNDLLRETTQIYSRVYLVNPKEDTVEVVETDSSDEKAGDIYFKIRQRFNELADTIVDKSDRDRFIEFFSPVNIKKTLKRVGDNHTGECFKVRKYDGTFRWDEFDVLGLRGGDSGEYLVMQRKSILNDSVDPVGVINRIDDTFKLSGSHKPEIFDEIATWKSITENSRIKFFWKDDNRRFRGVSQSFLDYYGIANADDILGKTDDEIGWHVDDEPYRDDELAVIRHGKRIIDSIGHTVVNGEVRLISASKFPVYRADRIVGLVGYFHQINDSTDMGDGTEIFSDQVTSLMNSRGILLSLVNFYDNYRRHKERFSAALIDIVDNSWDRHKDSENYKQKYYRFLSEQLRTTFSRSYVCGRVDASRFIVISKEEPAEVRKKVFALYSRLSDTKLIADLPAELQMTYSMVDSTEGYRPEEYLSVLERRRAGESAMETTAGADRIVVTSDQMEGVDERIYFADLNTYELLYMNKALKRDLGLPDNFEYKGLKCYQVIHHYDHICDHCSNPMLDVGRFVSRSYHNQVSGQDYLMRDTILVYGDSKVKASFAFSLTDNMRQAEMVNNVLHRRIRVNDLISQAFEEESSDKALDRILFGVGQELRADRAYIFEQFDDYLVNTYEWVAEGVSRQKDNLNHVPIADASPFYDAFDMNSTFVIEDAEEYRGTPLYEWLKPQDIHSLIEVPLKMKGKMIGFIGIDNPDPSIIGTSESILLSLSRFVSVLIRSRNAMSYLDELGQRDFLTNVMNRRALKTAVAGIDRNRPLIFVYADLNHLKEINDNEGHDSGDELIRSAANIMASYAGNDRVFRLGGDEFVVVIELNNILQADQVMRALRQNFEKESISVALGCALRTSPDDNIDDILREADEHMYANKVKMHNRDAGK